LSSRSGAKQIWRTNAEGRELIKLTDSSVPVTSAQILRDNSTIIYSTIRAGETSLFRHNPDGQTIKLADSIGEYWAVSPDETLLAVETRDKNTGAYRIELRSLADGQVVKSFALKPARQLGFTPDGKNLTYDSITDDVGQIMLQPLDGGEPRALTDFQTERIFSYSWSRDGNRLALIRGRILNDAVLIRANE
jgi:Tol biopolymer transport system component